MTNPIELQADANTDDYEEIPWSHLVEELGRPRYNVALTAAGVLVIGILVGFLIARFATGSTADAPAVEVDTTLGVAPVADAPANATTTPSTLPPRVSNPTAPQPEVAFSEADLMAVAGDQERTIASARAEWFVRDYFTIDGGDPDEQVTGLLTRHGVERPDAATTYVEWAHTLTIEPVAPGRYDVTVAFRVLSADGEAFVRQPARAVTVPVVVDESLAGAVDGLPRPAAFRTADVSSPPPTGTPAPASVIDEATLLALRFGSDPTPLRSWLDRGTWHIVMTVQHAGAAWPLLVDVPEPGSPP